MSDTTFFWHDYETFGRQPRRDRPAQFAGLRTDLDLNPIGQPVMWYCQPAPDVLPDPESCLLTGILPQHCLQHGLPEHQFAREIEAQLGAPGTIGVGYNSIRFDDEFTRHLFWRCLIDPYAREWRDGCGRWDVLDVLRCTWALRPDGVTWPTHDDGRPSFRLEDLTRANGLAHDAAHDALSDVRATLALARLVKTRQPRLWEFCLRLRRKEAVLDEIGANRPFVHLSSRYPVERGCLAVVWPLAAHPTNKNEVIVWDLAHDPRELLGVDAAMLRLRLFSKPEDLPEGLTRLPIKTLHINKSPIVIGNLKTVHSVAGRWGLDVEGALANAAHGEAVRAQLARPLWEQVFARETPAARPDVDEDLYGGFVGNEDRRQLERLRALSPEQLAAKLAGRGVAFEDSRLDELLFRYRARNFQRTLTDDEVQRWRAHCRARLLDGQGGAVSLPAFFDRLDELAENADERGQDILGALYDHAGSIAPE